MNTTTSLRSLKSVRSMKSDKSSRAASDEGELDFEEYIHVACKRFNCPVPIIVDKDFVRERSKLIRGREGTARSKRLNIVRPDSSDSSDFTTREKLNQLESRNVNSIFLTTFHDSMNRLVEILLANFKAQPIPRVTIQLIGLILHKYPQLNRFTIRNCRIDFYTLYELSRGLPYTTITDICLDDSPLYEGNYDILLCQSSNLRHLSLCRCHINDVVCERISSRLCYTEPAEENLLTLNLTTNQITDVGAKHLAEALRSNRHLRYLNLSDNLLTDEGASYILDVIVEFLLTSEEIIDKRHRYMLYLKKKRALYLECLLKLGQSPVEHVMRKHCAILPKKASVVKSKGSIRRERAKSHNFSNFSNEDNISLKAEMMANDLMGPFVDPFCSASVRIENGLTFCIGNLALCYLNLAYNDLTLASVKKLLAVLEYQHDFRKLSMNGLTKVVLDGNYIPVHCRELTILNHMLSKQIAYNSKQLSDKGFLSRKSVVGKNNPLFKAL